MMFRREKEQQEKPGRLGLGLATLDRIKEVLILLMSLVGVICGAVAFLGLALLLQIIVQYMIVGSR